LAEFTGERVIPGQVDPDLLNEHSARYAFAARLARAKRVLDAACGSGYGSAEMAKTATSVVGCDISEEAVRYAHESYRLPHLAFEQGSCTALPHADASFDLVVAFEAVEHIESWREFLSEVRRVLVPAGQFIVSTPNKLYYTETRARAGPNPFHVHEFEYKEFREELAQLFPYVSIFLENHVEGVIFQPVDGEGAAEVRIDAASPAPEEAHFFVAVCAHRPPLEAPAFLYVPSVANVLRERERHIGLLEAEIRQKNEWLEQARSELAGLNGQHQELLGMFRAQQQEVEKRTEWGMKLSRELDASGERIAALQQELECEQAAARDAVSAYETKLKEVEEDGRQKAQWALDTSAELQAKCDELARCVEFLHRAETTVEDRTRWAEQLQLQLYQLERQMTLYRASRWVKLGRRIGLGPELPGK
jgi:SAM-dependent methyltransferase